MLKTKTEIKHWLDLMGIEDYIINKDLTVDVNNNVNLFSRQISEIPVKFNIVERDFNCDNNQLTSSKDCPEIVLDSFNCNDNPLTSLEFCPKEIGGSFSCCRNKLKSLKYCTKKIKGELYCSDNQISLIPEYLRKKFMKQNSNFRNPILDLYFLDPKYKNLFKNIKYDTASIKQYRNEFQKFYELCFIRLEQINLDLWK